MTEIVCATETRDVLGESCIWCPTTRKVWWLDVLKPCLQSFDPATGAHQVYPLPGPNCGCVALRRSGGFVLAMPDGLHSFDPQSGALTFLVDAEPDQPHNRYNDGRCDRRGRFWIGTMHTEIKEPSGNFYRVGADHSVERLFGSISVPNSTAFSPDDRTLYFAELLAAGDLGVRFRHRRRRDFKSPGVRRLQGPPRRPRRVVHRCRGLPLERRVRRPVCRALRAGRARRSHDQPAGEEPDLLLFRRARPRHALCDNLDPSAQS